MEKTLFLAFRKFLLAASSKIQHAQWFIVDASDDDPHSLASFLHLTHEQLMLLLRGCQLTVKSENSDVFSATKFEGFIDHSLPAVEFSKLRIQKKRLYVLRIGAYKVGEKRFKYNDQTQMEKNGLRCILQYPPSDHHGELKSALFLYIKSVSNTETVHREVAAKQIPSTPPPTDKGSCRVIDTPLQLQLGASIIHETINLEKDFPYLHELGIKVKTDWNIRRLQREMEKLADTIESVNLSEIVAANDRVRTRIVVPRCKNFDVFMGSLRRQGKGKPSWLQTLLESVIPKQNKIQVSVDNAEDDIAENDDSGRTTEDAAKWILFAIGKEHEEAFTFVAKKLGMPVNGDKFSPEEFLAMSEDANIGVSGQRMLRRWLLSKDLDILPTECQLRGLGADYLQPITEKVIVDKKKFIYSYRPLPDIVKQCLLDNWQSNLTIFELHVGRDHGQGAFHAPLKFNFLYSDGYSSYETLFFQVDCDKDLYVLLQKTLATPLNSGLRSIMEKDVASGESPDGRMLFSENEDGSMDCCFARSGELSEGRHAVPFKVYVVGDLAFYATALGKDGSSGQHCYVCDIPRMEWQLPGHTMGELWSLQKLHQTHASLDEKTTRIRGVVGKPLIECVDVDRFLPPLMHIMMGTGNMLLESILDAIDKADGLEDTPASLREKRHEHWTKKKEYNECKEMFSIWSEFGGARLANLRISRTMLIHIIAADGKHWEKIDKDFAIADKQKMAEKISGLVTEKKMIEKTMKDTNAELSVVRRELQLEEQKYPRRERALLQQIEEHFLERYGVKREVYHGGDLTGGSVKKLMQNSRLIFTELEGFLKDVADEKKIIKEKDWGNLAERLRLTRLCLESFDGLFSRLRSMPTEQKSATEMRQESASFLEAGLKYWRALGLSITPKIHMLEDHVLLKLQAENGLWNKDEEFVERAHQMGLKYKKITKNSMSDAARRYSYMSRWERARSTAEIKRLQIRAATNRKRNMKPNLDSKTKKMKLERDHNRSSALLESHNLDEEEQLL